MSDPQQPGPEVPPPYGTPRPNTGSYLPPPPDGYPPQGQPPQGQYPQGPYPPPPYGPPNPYGYAYDPEAKSKLAAGLFGIFLGALGIHRFYLGYTGIGLIMLLLTVLSCGLLSPLTSVWGLIEGILYLAASPGTSFAHDATGRPLRS